MATPLADLAARYTHKAEMTQVLFKLTEQEKARLEDIADYLGTTLVGVFRVGLDVIEERIKEENPI